MGVPQMVGLEWKNMEKTSIFMDDLGVQYPYFGNPQIWATLMKTWRLNHDKSVNVLQAAGLHIPPTLRHGPASSQDWKEMRWTFQRENPPSLKWLS